jgi:hypothetical protein
MFKYNEELAKAGVLVSLEGLAPPAMMSARVTFKGGNSKNEMVEVRQFFEMNDFEPQVQKKFEKYFEQDEYTLGQRENNS